MGRLAGKLAVITGAAQGLGEGVARKFSEEGSTVILVDLNEERGKQVETEIKQNGGNAIFKQVDVGDEQQIIRLYDFITATYGKLDILHTNTWAGRKDNAADLSLSDWQTTMDITLTAPFLFSKYAIPLMQKAGGGSIVHTSSVGGLVAFRNDAAYMAAKAGVIHLCKSIAVDFGADKIRCNAICPGVIETPQTRPGLEDDEQRDYYYSKCLTGELGKPEDIANASVYLASDESTFVTGAEFKIDNGWTVI